MANNTSRKSNFGLKYKACQIKLKRKKGCQFYCKHFLMKMNKSTSAS